MLNNYMPIRDRFITCLRLEKIKSVIHWCSVYLIPFSLLQLALSSCTVMPAAPTIFTATNHAFGSVNLAKAKGIDSIDLENLDKGNLQAIKTRYEPLDFDKLTLDQQRLLCDVYVKYNDISQALRCLDRLEERMHSSADTARIPKSDFEAIVGKRALVYLKSGQYELAAQSSFPLNSHGGRYVYALAAIHIGKINDALIIAENLERYEDVDIAYLAANIFLAAGKYDRALKIALDPALRLAVDYGLSPHKGVFGSTIEPGVFRADIFDEFNFGLFDYFSYAPPSNVYVEFIVAKSLLETDRVDEARERFDVILNYESIPTYRDIYWVSLAERARIAEAEGDIEAAIDLNRQAIEVIESIRSTILTDLGRIGFVADKQDIYANLIALLVQEKQYKLAIEYVERAKGRALVDLLSSKTNFATAPGDSINTPRLFQTYMAEETELLSDTSVGNPNLFATRRSAQRQAKKILTQEAPWQALLATVPPLSLDELIDSVSAKETIVGYYTHKGRWMVFVIGYNRSPVIQEIKPGDVEQSVSGFRKVLEEPSNRESQAYLNKAEQLYRSLIGPIEHLLEGSEIVTFLPSGPLFYLPFGALYTGHEFLVEKYALRVLPNASVLSVLRPVDKVSQSMLVLGNPYREKEGDLPFAELESKAVAQLSTGALLLIREKATDVIFRQTSGDYGYIHIASHAEFVETQPLASRLLLSPTGESSGDIYLNDLFNLELDANLVVLSACQTSLSQVANGDELIGLSTGFLYAGTSGIIGSLWQIEDESTAFLMEKFYRRLVEGYTPERALQDAQLTALAHSQYRHPYYWAAFQFTGHSGS